MSEVYDQLIDSLNSRGGSLPAIRCDELYALLTEIFTAAFKPAAQVGGFAGGTFIWFITLMVPLLANAGLVSQALISQGFFGAEFLRPDQLFGLSFSDAYTRGVVLSISVNVLALYMVSALDKTRLSDRIQAIAFVNRVRAEQPPGTAGLQIKKSDLTSMLTQFLGESATNRLLDTEPRPELIYASPELLGDAEAFAEHLHGRPGVAGAEIGGSGPAAIATPPALFVLHPPDETRPSTPEAEGAASGCLRTRPKGNSIPAMPFP